MATISSTMAINDAMSPALNSITAAVNSLTAAFEAMQRASGQSVNTPAIDSANNALRETERQQEAVNDSLERGSNVAGELWGKIKGFIAAYAGWELVRQTVAWSDEMTNVQARIANINDGQQTNAQLMDMIYQSAQNARGSFQSMSDLVGRFGNNAKDAFSSNAELVAFAEQLQKQFTISGANAIEAENAMIQLSQGLAAGVLRGEELNSVFEQAPSIIQTIAKHMGVPIGQIRTLASEGKITADIVKAAMLGAAEETNKKFSNMPLTFSAAWTMTKNTIQMSMLDIQKALESIFNSGQFQAILDSLANTVASVIPLFVGGIKVVASVVGFLYEQWKFLKPAIMAVVTAMTLYKGVTLATLAIEKISRLSKMAMIVAEYGVAMARGATVGATTAATAAQMGLNAAMLASPIGWVIAGISAIVGLFYLAVAAVNHFAGTSYSATGMIAGAIAGFYAFFKSIFVAIWNILLSVAEFFINVWQNPIYSLKKLLYSVAETFADLYGSILSGLDPVITGIANGIVWAVNQGIKALNWLSGALDNVGLGWGQIGEMQATSSVAKGYNATKNQMLAMINPGSAPENYKSLDNYKLDMPEIADYMDAGYKAGSNFADDPMGAIKNAIGLGEDPAIQEMLNQQKEQTKAAKQTAENTTPKSDQDFKYIKDVMGARAIDRLAGSNIKIEMTNNNAINSAMDINRIIDTLTDKLRTALTSGAEGVHQ